MPTQRVRIDKRQPLTELLSIAKCVNCSCKYQDLLSNKRTKIHMNSMHYQIYTRNKHEFRREAVFLNPFLDETMVSTLVKIYFLNVTI